MGQKLATAVSTPVHRWTGRRIGAPLILARSALRRFGAKTRKKTAKRIVGVQMEHWCACRDVVNYNTKHNDIVQVLVIMTAERFTSKTYRTIHHNLT